MRCKWRRTIGSASYGPAVPRQPAGVQALVKANAATLAIENYLVQLDGFSWAVAQAQVRAGFPIRHS
jgi:hypothetical protein